MYPPHRASLKRRTFLRLTGGATVALAGAQFPLRGQEPARRPDPDETVSPLANVLKSGEQLHVTLHEADRMPLSLERARTLVARDLSGETVPCGIGIGNGVARIDLLPQPVQLGLRLKVPGFGEVICYADNDGRGYSERAQIAFVPEAARTRLRRVRELAEVAGKLGVPSDPEVERRIAAAAQPIPAAPVQKRIAAAYDSLANGLHAGEMLTLNIARHRISKFAKPRSEFLFGCLTSDLHHGPEFQKILSETFNFGVLGWYSWAQTPDPIEKRLDYSTLDKNLEWCVANRMVPKGFGYVYLTPGALPTWIRDWPYEKLLPEYKRIVTQTTRRYAGRVPYVEVVNELHDKANLFHLSHPQMVELTRESCKAAREGDPNVKRIINHCCLWAEYAKAVRSDGEPKWSPYRYLKECISAGTEFEIVGLQLYYPQQDLMEIDHKLERFKDFNRPLHISEVSCNSAGGLDTASMRPKSVVPGWHGPWTESMQADWLEAVCTICYSKPEFEAVDWWNIADFGGHFWPYGGLLYDNLKPKESYFRLQNLQKRWGVAKTA